MPRSSRPGVASSRGARAPTASTTASSRSRSCGRPRPAPMSALGPEHRALGRHLVEPPIDEVLGHLEVRDAVAQQAAEAVVALEDGHVVAGPGQLLGSGQPGRPGTDDGDPLAGAFGGRLRLDAALVEGPLDDRHLDLLDRDRVGVDGEHAGGFARRRADPAGELGEVVRRVQPLARVAPVATGDELVPLRDQVAERAAAMAERHAAVHAPAACSLTTSSRARR